MSAVKNPSMWMLDYLVGTWTVWQLNCLLLQLLCWTSIRVSFCALLGIVCTDNKDWCFVYVRSYFNTSCLKLKLIQALSGYVMSSGLAVRRSSCCRPQPGVPWQPLLPSWPTSVPSQSSLWHCAASSWACCKVRLMAFKMNTIEMSWDSVRQVKFS